MPIRVIIGPNRSGTTALLRCFENNSYVARILYQPIKFAIRSAGAPDYGFLDLPNRGISVAKDTIGLGFPDSPLIEATFQSYRNHQDLEKGRYIFLFRDPFVSFYSDHRKFRIGIEAFVLAYKNAVYQALLAKRLSEKVSILTYEILQPSPKKVLQLICSKWGIPFDPDMLCWKLPFGSKMDKSIQKEPQLTGQFRRVYEEIQGDRFIGSIFDSSRLSSNNAERIRNELLPLYGAVRQIAQSDFLIKKKRSS